MTSTHAQRRGDQNAGGRRQVAARPVQVALRGELNRVSQMLTGRIRQLAERYETPLPQLTDLVAESIHPCGRTPGKNGGGMGLKPGYKQTEVSPIPVDLHAVITNPRRFNKDWEIKRLGDFTDCVAGGTPSTLNKEYWGGPIRWMSSGELNNKIIKDVEKRITEQGLRESSTKIIPPRCVLIGLAGQGKTRGTVAINLVEICTNQSIAAILPNESFVPEYLYYNLDARYHELRGMSTGDGGRGGLNLQIIRSVFVPFPEISEQRAIAEALSDVDGLLAGFRGADSQETRHQTSHDAPTPHR